MLSTMLFWVGSFLSPFIPKYLHTLALSTGYSLANKSFGLLMESFDPMSIFCKIDHHAERDAINYDGFTPISSLLTNIPVGKVEEAGAIVDFSTACLSADEKVCGSSHYMVRFALHV